MKLKNTLALSLAAVMAAGLTACGSGSNSFTWFVDSIPANLDPQVASSAADVIACENLYSGLVRKDASGKLVPALAEIPPARYAEFSHSLVADFFETGVETVRAGNILHHGHDVYDRFRRQALYRGAAYMVDRNEFSAEDFLDQPRLPIEFFLP